ncbi:molecular chaperone [Candidatus Symbiopectobacterium sp. NZEC127]|uniref:fimbrial biogenesis chaperone n=1 Tax=Candidatus Symbiopectobacterium sp. NZEC127 TaxID=2820472 RepID=UPI0022276E4F|nr:molecular chaperone [Candidatus Symbiopectobacterium sp. NZEC127]MCW2485399.1 molecular chaperone [Candidatus Symbiopectobacterium sp. NZEC127]
MAQPAWRGLLFWSTGTLLSGIFPAYALLPTEGGIRLNQTRIVFPASEKAQTVTITNSDTRTYLVQSRVQLEANNTAPAPFFATPPVFLLKPDSRQLLRIVPQGGTLPSDRESVFYLSVVAIPSRPTKDDAPVQISAGLQFLIKLFYRPPALPPVSETTACPLHFSRQGQAIRVQNPTPYHQTLGRLVFDQTGVNLHTQPAMLAPMSTLTFTVSASPLQAEWQTINDYGGLSAPCKQQIATTQEVP